MVSKSGVTRYVCTVFSMIMTVLGAKALNTDFSPFASCFFACGFYFFMLPDLDATEEPEQDSDHDHY